MRKNKTNGISLIEVLIALVILSVGLLGLGTFQTSVIRANAHALNLTQAVINAQSKIESLRYYNVSEISSGQDEILAANTQFTRQWQSSDLSKNNQKIKTQVSWPDQKLSAKSGKSLASETTQVSLVSAISSQVYSDASIWFKVANEEIVTINLGPNTPQQAKTMMHNRSH